MITILDYGMGNLRSVHKAMERVGYQALVTQDPTVIEKADGLVLPGVGAFQKAMDNLETLKLIDPVIEFIRSDRPFLGICLGLQLLFSEGEEFGIHKGLGILAGRVVRFPFSQPGEPSSKDSLKVPHMGWNSVQIK